MFDIESTDQLDSANKQVMTKSVHNSSIVQVLIPKVEPLSSLETTISESMLNEGNEQNEDQVVEVSIPFTAPYKIRDPIIVLERCDKIWQTLKIIKDANITDPIDTSINVVPPEVTSSSSYIKYEPMLTNDTNIHSLFKFVVKDKKTLFHCLMCGKQFSNKYNLKCHSYKAHSIHTPQKPKCLSNEDTMMVNEQECNNVTENISLDIATRNSEENPVTETLQTVSEFNITSTTNDLTKQCISMQLRNRKVDSINKSVENGQEEKTLSTEVEPQRACLLCKQSVTNMKNHLITYHKIHSPDFVLKNITEAYPKSATKSLGRDNLNRTVEEMPKDDFTHLQSKKRRASTPYINPNKKRKLNVGNKGRNEIAQMNGIKTCAICSGNYKRSSYYHHVLLHRKRGETQKNFNLLNTRYRIKYVQNEKILKKYKVRSKSSAFLTSLNKSTESKEDNSNPDTNGKVEKPKIENDGKDENIAQKSKNKIQHYATRTKSDKISSIGITMTFKKKIDAYKVVHEDGNDDKSYQISRSENIDESSNISDNNIQKETKNHVDNLRSFDYSRNHSILRIQCVEEDIDIDIEEDPQKTYRANILKTMNVASKEKQEAPGAERISENIKTNRDCEPHQKENNSRSLKWELRSKKRINDTQGKYNTNFPKNYVCHCGKQFYTKKGFDIHMNEVHTSSNLSCGYCAEHFSNVGAWYLHECAIREGKQFVDLMMELNCYYCNTIHKTYKTFDEHVREKHFNHRLPYLCFMCSERFCTEADRKIHWSENHIILCSICKMEYNILDKSKHKAYHCGFGIPCHTCKKAYTNLITYRNHMKRRVLHKRRKINKRISL